MVSGELRCNSKLHGVLHNNFQIEVKCNSVFCGASKEVVVLHVFSIQDDKIKLIDTKKFRNPKRKEMKNGLG